MIIIRKHNEPATHLLHFCNRSISFSLSLLLSMHTIRSIAEHSVESTTQRVSMLALFQLRATIAFSAQFLNQFYSVHYKTQFTSHYINHRVNENIFTFAIDFGFGFCARVRFQVFANVVRQLCQSQRRHSTQISNLFVVVCVSEIKID
jgi:alcohol dehydrogenase YqhD (iron-dependent ADH family)